VATGFVGIVCLLILINCFVGLCRVSYRFLLNYISPVHFILSKRRFLGNFKLVLVNFADICFT